MWNRILAIGAVLLVLAACGASPRPGTAQGEPGVRELADAWYQAVVHDHPDQACRLMTGQLREEFIAASRTDTCHNAVRTYAETLDDRAQAAINAKDFLVTMKGADYATVELNTTSTLDIFAVHWRNGSWLLAGVVE